MGKWQKNGQNLGFGGHLWQDLCDRERHCLKMCFAILCLFLLDIRACNHCLKGPQKPKTYCNNKPFAILSFTSVFVVRLGTGWRQDLAILSPEGSRDSAFQLRIDQKSARYVKIFEEQYCLFNQSALTDASLLRNSHLKPVQILQHATRI